MTILMVVVASLFSLTLTERGSQNSAAVALTECSGNSVLLEIWDAQGPDRECVVWFLVGGTWLCMMRVA